VGEVAKRLPLCKPSDSPQSDGFSLSEIPAEAVRAFERYEGLRKYRAIKKFLRDGVCPIEVREVLQKQALLLEFETGLRQMELFK
jgi:hypothetical protein